jgi:hypothetical protein
MTEIETYIYRNTQATESDIKDYFKFKYRGLFYQQMKTHAAKLLRKKGMIYTDIAKVINLKNHDAAIHHINTKKIDKVAESIVLANFDEWILSKLYPMTATIYEYDSRNKEKISTISHILVNK